MALTAGEAAAGGETAETQMAGVGDADGWLPPAYRRDLAILVAAFAVSRLAYALAGVRFDASPLHPANMGQVQWQLLPVNLLQHDLLRSVWNLHSQPPLYNLFCGVLLHLPGSLRAGTALLVYICLGLAMVVATFLLLTQVGVGRRVALAVTLVVVADPSAILYERWLSWSYPTAALLVVGALGVARLARTGVTRWAAVSAACFAAVVLLDTTFQWPWFLAALVAVGVAGRRRLRPVLRAALLPLLVVAMWTVKDVAQFGTLATSSWLGMNLDQSTLAHATGSDLESLTKQGHLDRLAALPPFRPVDSYVPAFVTPRRTGVPALDQTVAEQGVPNYNDLAYVPLSRKYLSDDLAYIRARPGRYASGLTVSAELWSIPADQFIWLSANYGHLSGYARLFDAVVHVQPMYAGMRVSYRVERYGRRPPVTEMSWTIAAVTLIDLIAAPWAIYRRSRDTGWAVPMALLWVTVTYSFVVTTATEMAENMRFHFELGTLPAVLAVATVAALLRGRGAAGSVPAVNVSGPPGPDVDA